MSAISVDVANLRSFATAISNLVTDLKSSAFLPASLRADPNGLRPDVAQNTTPVTFTDGKALYDAYSRKREGIIGDQSTAPGSFNDFLGQLDILASVASQIADNYEKADNETAFDAAAVDAALNAAPPPSSPTQSSSV